MLYSILCYDRESDVFSMTKEEDEDLMCRLGLNGKAGGGGAAGTAAPLDAHQRRDHRAVER